MLLSEKKLLQPFQQKINFSDIIIDLKNILFAFIAQYFPFLYV